MAISQADLDQNVSKQLWYLSKSLYAKLNVVKQRQQITYKSSGMSQRMRWRNHELFAEQKINEILKSLMLQNDGTPKSKQSQKMFSNIVQKLLNEVYSEATKQFVSSVYAYNNVDNIYKEWIKLPEACRCVTKVANTQRQRLLGLFEKDQNSTAKLQAWSWFESKAFYEEIYACMKRRDILTNYQMCIINRYVWKNSNDLYIPKCIGQTISIYYEPISLRCKIRQMINEQIENVLSSTDNRAQYLFETLNRLETLYSMIGKDFYVQCKTDIIDIISKFSKQWNSEYLSEEIGIMKYTNKIEIFSEKVREENYTYDKHCLEIFIASYIQTVLKKHNGSYDALVTSLSKTQLKRIYKLFFRVSYKEAKKLNNAYKNTYLI